MIVKKLVSVYCADKLVCEIDGVGKKVGVQVQGIVAPQINGECKKEKLVAMEANHSVKAFFLRAKKIELKNITTTNVLIADVYVDGKSLAEYLIKMQYAVPTKEAYEQMWC